MYAAVNLWHPKKGYKKVGVFLPDVEFSWKTLIKALKKRGLKGYYIISVVDMRTLIKRRKKVA